MFEREAKHQKPRTKQPAIPYSGLDYIEFLFNIFKFKEHLFEHFTFAKSRMYLTDHAKLIIFEQDKKKIEQLINAATEASASKKYQFDADLFETKACLNEILDQINRNLKVDSVQQSSSEYKKQAVIQIPVGLAMFTDAALMDLLKAYQFYSSIKTDEEEKELQAALALSVQLNAQAELERTKLISKPVLPTQTSSSVRIINAGLGVPQEAITRSPQVVAPPSVVVTKLPGITLTMSLPADIDVSCFSMAAVDQFEELIKNKKYLQAHAFLKTYFKEGADKMDEDQLFALSDYISTRVVPSTSEENNVMKDIQTLLDNEHDNLQLNKFR